MHTLSRLALAGRCSLQKPTLVRSLFLAAGMMLASQTGPAIADPIGGLAIRSGGDAQAERVPRRNPEAVPTEYREGLWWVDADDSGSGAHQHFVAGTRYAVDGVFTDVRPTGPLRVIDLAGAYMIPPLGDAHVHRIEGPWDLPALHKALASGIFYMKNPSSFGPVVQRYRGLFNRPDAMDATWSQGAITGSGSHPVPLYRNLAGIYRTPVEELEGKAYFEIDRVADLERRWSEILSGKPDFLKVLFVNTETGGKTIGTPAPVAARAVTLAHASGIHVTAHVVSAIDLEAALDAGVDEITHMPGWAWLDGTPWPNIVSPELARRMADSEVALVVTAGIAATEGWREEGWEPSEVEQLLARNLRRMVRAGVRTYIGTDNVLSARDEVEYLRRLRIRDDEEWLRAWIRTGPEAIFPTRAIGRLHAGYEASFVALRCDPVVDFTCIDQIVRLEKQGEELVPDAANP